MLHPPGDENGARQLRRDDPIGGAGAAGKYLLASRAQEGIDELYLATTESIQQRAAMVLKDVHYVIDAHFDMTDKAAPGDNPGKFQDIIKRRLERGQCYSMPYFGTREFAAHFARCTELPPCPEELLGERDLGWMLWDMDYTDPQDIKPKFFRAKLVDGAMDVPPPESGEVKM